MSTKNTFLLSQIQKFREKVKKALIGGLVILTAIFLIILAVCISQDYQLTILVKCLFYFLSIVSLMLLILFMYLGFSSSG